MALLLLFGGNYLVYKDASVNVDEYLATIDGRLLLESLFGGGTEVAAMAAKTHACDSIGLAVSLPQGVLQKIFHDWRILRLWPLFWLVMYAVALLRILRVVASSRGVSPVVEAAFVAWLMGCTFLPYYGAVGTGEMAGAALTLLALAALVRGNRLWAAVLWTLAVTTKLYYLIYAPVLLVGALYADWKGRKTGWRALPGMAIVSVLVAASVTVVRLSAYGWHNWKYSWIEAHRWVSTYAGLGFPGSTVIPGMQTELSSEPIQAWLAWLFAVGATLFGALWLRRSGRKPRMVEVVFIVSAICVALGFLYFAFGGGYRWPRRSLFFLYVGYGLGSAMLFAWLDARIAAFPSIGTKALRGAVLAVAMAVMGIQAHWHYNKTNMAQHDLDPGEFNLFRDRAVQSSFCWDYTTPLSHAEPRVFDFNR